MYLLYICFDDSLVVYTVNLRVQNKLGIWFQIREVSSKHFSFLFAEINIVCTNIFLISL